MTSNDIAASFRGSAQPSPQPKSSGSKIPNMRLSFITAADQAKFEHVIESLSSIADSKLTLEIVKKRFLASQTCKSLMESDENHVFENGTVGGKIEATAFYSSSNTNYR
jgi:hypothetical protein